jgi:hypothetical protein
MTYLVNNASGIIANDNSTNPPIYNRDPVFVANNLLTTIYAWAAVWDTAEIQIYVSPQCKNSIIAPVWYPIGAAITGNAMFTFQDRWGQIKAVVTGATALSEGIYCTIFDAL